MSQSDYTQWLNVPNTTGFVGYSADTVPLETCCAWTNKTAPEGEGLNQGINILSSTTSPGDQWCGAFWTDPSDSASPAAVVTWTVGQSDTAQLITFDGTNATLGQEYCHLNNGVANRSNQVDYFFTNGDTTDVNICMGRNTDCQQWTFGNNPCSSSQLNGNQFINIAANGTQGQTNQAMTTVQAQAGSNICFGLWQDGANPNDPPNATVTIPSLPADSRGAAYSWDGTNLTIEQRYTTCQQGGNGGQRCNNTSQCTGGLVCDTNTHQCVPCTDNSQCSSGEVCTSGQCQSSSNNNGGGGDFFQKYWWLILIIVIVIIVIIWIIIAASRKKSTDKNDS